ncbi:phosphodiester glycosidase family protein [Baekduia soli]|uniref:phosphodiester glycosidase family protein n=1 Tax=Baekduia soli TaxID=496014 RepID=UPI001652433D|nr:phosphodiester glycosidase family protein [Baekduia soli]
MTASAAGSEPPARATARGRRRRVAAVAVVLVLLGPALISYAVWMLRPTSMAFGVRSVEWVRADVPFGNAIVDVTEQAYYGAHAPRKGGPQLKRLPLVGLGGPAAGPTPAAGAPSRHAAWPRPIRPVFAQPLPGEGVWHPAGPPVASHPPVLLTTFRPEVDYPRVVAYVAWFDHARTAIAYYPGRYEPPRAAVRGPMMVPSSQRGRLLATFNAGFIATDVHNGSTDNGRVNEPLTDGNATLVGYRDGRIDIVRWRGGPNAGTDVAWSRQSLRPIVWNGHLNPELNSNPDSPQWGFSLGHATRVWRTGVGIDRRGNLLFVAADGQTVITLAKILRHIGAVRAMQFDINPEWHTLITYSHGHDVVPRLVEPQPQQSANRYLVPDDRDFFAVYRRLSGPVTVPFK